MQPTAPSLHVLMQQYVQCVSMFDFMYSCSGRRVIFWPKTEKKKTACKLMCKYFIDLGRHKRGNRGKKKLQLAFRGIEINYTIGAFIIIWSM